MAKSLQDIEDYYISQGLKEENLRKALEKDQEFQALLLQKKAVIRNKFGISKKDEKEYLLPTQKDYKILSLIHELAKLNLSDSDREIIEVIKTQLLDDWRSPLERKLLELKEKYTQSH